MRRLYFVAIIILFCMGILHGQATLSLPYLESFSGNFPPSAGPGLAWVARDIDADGFNWRYHLDEDANQVAMSESWVQLEGEDDEGDLTPNNWLITPAIQFAEDGLYTLRFNYKAYIPGFPEDKLFVYIMQANNAAACNPANPATLLLHSILSMPESFDWNEVTIVIDGSLHTGIRHIGFRHGECGGGNNWAVQVDNVLIRQNLADDLEAVSISSPSTFPTDLPFTVRIQNIGTNPVSEGAYTVQFYVAGNPSLALGLPITDTPALVVGESVNITSVDHTSWSIPIEGDYETKQIYAVVTYETDEVPANNQSPSHSIYVFPPAHATIPVIYPGGRVTNTIPVNYYWYQSLAQSIYTQEELGGAANIGYITDLVLTFTSGGDISSNAQHGNITVYLANAPTTLNSFASASSHYHHSNFSQVFSGRLTGVGAPSGQREILIHFATPFLYAGENLVVMMNKTATATASALNMFHLNPGTASVNRTLYSYSMGNPFSVEVLPPPGGMNYTHIGYPKIVFAMQHSNLGTLSGTVTSATGVLDGVNVEVDLFPSVLTDSIGEYSLTGIPTTEAVTFTKFGYEPQTFEANEVGWVIIDNEFVAGLDVEMVELAGGFTISGQVKLNDTGEWTSGVEVELQGYATDTTTTDNAGYFEFAGLFAETYTIAINRHGYNQYTSPPITLTTTDYSLPEITLVEQILPPLTAMAEYVDDSNVIVRWVNPLWGYTNFSLAGLEVEGRVGAGDDGEFILAHRYTHEALVEYGVAGYDLYQVGFVPIGDEASYSIIVWTTEDTGLQYPTGLTPAVIVEVTNELSASQINNVNLPALVHIPEYGQLFIGVRFDSIDCLLGMDVRETVNGYGNLAALQGLWTTLTSFNISGTVAIYASALEPDNLDAPMSTVAGLTRALSGEYVIRRYLEPSPTPTVIPVTVPMPTQRDFVYTDAEWANLPNGVYFYEVQAKYNGVSYLPSGFLSLATPANSVRKAPVGTLTVNVSMSGGAVAGAIISLTNPDPLVANHSHTLSPEENGSHTFYITLNSQYAVSVTLANATSYEGTHTFNQTANTLNISLLPTTFSQSFNGPQPEGWVNIDTDGDGYFWEFNNIENNGPTVGTTAAYSFSYYLPFELSLYPDNWLISPSIQLPAEGAIDLEFMVIARDPFFPSDRLLVYIAPAGDGTPGWETFLQNKTSNLGESGSPDQETLLPNTTLLADITLQATGSTWLTFNHNISAYAGQEVRVAYRHAFCEDWFVLKLANMLIMTTPPNLVTVSGVVVELVEGEQVHVQEASVSLSSTMPLYALTDEQGVFTIANVPGETQYTVTVSKDGFYINNDTQIVVGAENYVHPTPIVLERDPASDSDITVKPWVTGLLANYPNPFNPSTTIAFELASEGRVVIDIYNIKGQKVKTLGGGVYGAGVHSVVWNGDDVKGRSVGSGIYFYRMVSAGYVGVRKMVMMK